MNDEINELYQQVILDHYKNPRNYGELEPHNHEAEGFNPLCGDHYNIRLEVENGKIAKIKFDGDGCAISKASASVMTTLLEGKTVEEARKLFEDFHYVITSDISTEIDPDRYGKIAVFAGVREFPSRIKCANLAWHTMVQALDEKLDNKHPVTTDENNMTDVKALKEKVIAAIKKVSDPEIPVDVWEMGLIYKCDVAANGEVYIEMTLTTPTCPEAGFLPAEVQRNIQEIPEVTKAMVEITFEPPWDTSKMSEDAKMILNMG